ncbi:MAG: Rrf2 family transcriptional regulator [Anaerolineales bacterium]|nr:Rrf2 family transcriptional regulator [Anaerolineales bacterium]MCW5855157.1 Rrf2 family transcriptional regulator [Anaerolineales bacterium]MCW5877256.1 Rrf2 family transcriptional regulator [Anaerolineales bacterium]
MKLTARSEYALLALVYLARNSEISHIPVETIAKAQGIPPRFLEQILLSLKRAHVVRSVKGQRGGYSLARPANEIFLADIIRVFDGALAPTESVSKNFYEATPVEKEEGLLRVFRDIRDYTSNKMETTSLADVVVS